MQMPGWGTVPTASPWRVDPCTVVSLQDLTVYGSRPPYDGTHFSLTGWDGWTNGVDRTGGPVPWENADGGVEGDVWEGGRSITLEGDIEAASHYEMMEAQERLGAVLTSPRWDWLVVDEEHLGLSRQIRVHRPSRPRITDLGITFAVWTLTLQAATFPRLDTTEQSKVIPSSGVDLVNAGNHPAAVTLTLRGPLTNPGLSWPGGSWVYRGSVGSGQTISVDMARRVVRDPATSRQSRNLVVASSTDWLRLAPGTTRVSRTGTGAGSITAAWRSSWS